LTQQLGWGVPAAGFLGLERDVWPKLTTIMIDFTLKIKSMFFFYILIIFILILIILMNWIIFIILIIIFNLTAQVFIFFNLFKKNDGFSSMVIIFFKIY
jgi:hypothetical protein